MSDDEECVAESTIGRAITEQCKFDKEMLGMMKVYNKKILDHTKQLVKTNRMPLKAKL